ncbi:MAG TPA: class I SAM-dependent methyltransferase [Pyrinomonadaceae bacterium]|nr:class I SAM-dependent methyltransferase [Pyrinomonadaceae bacterium]
MKVQQAYTEWAATYDSDRNLTRDLDQQVMRDTFAHQRFGSVLEIGCGTGKNTALLAGIAGKVNAIDFSAAMIAKAKEKSTFDNVTFTVADITERWPCPDASTDLVTCNLVLEHINDLSFIFSEATRVLNGGGQLFVSELHPFRQYLGVQARFEHKQETTKIEAFVHHVTDFTDAARHHNLILESMKEWQHEEDRDKPPRLISFLFTRPEPEGLTQNRGAD